MVGADSSATRDERERLVAALVAMAATYCGCSGMHTGMALVLGRDPSAGNSWNRVGICGRASAYNMARAS